MQLPTTGDVIWFVSVLIAVAIVSAGSYATFKDLYRLMLPRRLQTFPQMRRAFILYRRSRDFRNWPHSAVFAMRRFAEQGADPAQREEIAALMRDAIAGMMHKTDNRTANKVRQMLETLAASAPSWEADFLERVARSKVEGWSRGFAMRRLADLRGVTSLDILIALADERPVTDQVAYAIASIGPAAATPAVVARLSQILGDTQNGWAPSAAARALIAIGHGAEPNLMVHIDKFDVWTRFAVRVKAAGIDASALIEWLLAAGIIGEDRRTMIEPSMIAGMQRAIDAGDAFIAVVQFLEQVRSVYNFDTEWDPVPAYGALLAQLSEISSPRLPITNIVAPEDGGEVSCRVAGHSARFNPKFMGDWTDLQAVLGGLNDALAEAGRSERFANLHSGGQDAYVIVGSAEGLAGLVEKLGLPLDADANATVAVGIAAEDHAAAQIQAEHPGAKITRGWTRSGR